MLSYLKEHIKCKKEINVVYLGGSITEGAGASMSTCRWSSMIHRWFQETYPMIQWNEYNAGIGGTNSEFGIFRLDSDVLIHNPDLVFVEFAVNDYNVDREQVLDAMEEIVRRIRNKFPKCEIIFIITATMDMERTYYSLGMTPESVQIHDEVAEYYGIPSIHVGEVLLERIRNEKVDSKEYFIDGVHPNNKGYQQYFETIKEYLSIALKEEKEEKVNAVMPDYIGSGKYKNARMIDARKNADTAFCKEGISLYRRYQGYISSNVPGTKGSLEFEGTGIGVYWSISCDSGILAFRIDGGEVQEVSSWDKHALNFDRCNHQMLVSGLEYGKHKLQFWVSDKKDEKSFGNFVRIAAFLIL